MINLSYGEKVLILFLH